MECTIMKKRRDKMKKAVVGFIALLGIVFLASCGSNQKNKTFTNEQNGVQMELVFNYEGDEVKKQTANNVMPYSSIGVSTKEEAQQLLDPIAKQYKAIKGIDYSIDYGDDEATESLTIDYTDLDYEAAKQLPGVSFEGDTSNGISMERTEKMLLDQGYTLKK
jgi:uncharacterized lipoprotein YehR (DUF1307 family)